MARDRHAGRQGGGAFVIKGSPEKYVSLINNHGIFARLVRSRRCPCTTETGSPSMACRFCHSDGMRYDFQRELLQQDEYTDIRRTDTTVLLPFRVPVLRPLKVETVLSPDQGGIVRHEIISFTGTEIKIAATKKPKYYYPVRISYMFDRWEKVENETPLVNEQHGILYAQGPLFNDGTTTGNIQEAAGDIVTVEKIWDVDTGFVYTQFSFERNYIFIENGPTVRPGKIRISYHYVPVERILFTELTNKNPDGEDFTRQLSNGQVRAAMQGWFDVGQGDLMTLLTDVLYRDEVISHHRSGVDKITEFEAANIDSHILDAKGNIYARDRDYILLPRNKIKWVGTRPGAGHSYSVRYGYRPTLIVYQEGVQPNALENKLYPKVVFAEIYSRTRHKELARLDVPSDAPEQPAQFFYQE